MENKKRKIITYLCVTAVLSAVSYLLMILEFSLPFLPSFLKLDFSEIPALIATFSMGPLYGVLVCLIKCLLHCPFTQTGCVGEFANFLLGAVFTLTAGILYKHNKNRKTALLSMLFASLVMAMVSFPVNYFITYPVYATFMPIETIISLYQVILPSVNGLVSCLLIFNLPFTFAKGLVASLVTFLIYKRISPLIHKLAGNNKKMEDESEATK